MAKATTFCASRRPSKKMKPVQIVCTSGAFRERLLECGKSVLQYLVFIRTESELRHKTSSVKAWLARHSRFHLHFTPTSGSWLNLVERWFALISERQIKRGTHRSTVELERAIREYLDIYNEDPKPFIWTKSADAILASVARFCKRISDSGH